MVADAVEALQTALLDRNIEVRILSGIEVDLTPVVVNMVASDNVCTLNESRYVLIELSTVGYPHYLEQVMFELQVKGFSPVLAYPEPCKAFQDDIGLLYKVVERGALVQLTAASITGGFGKMVQTATTTILEHNLARIIASDAHSLDGRPPILSNAVSFASNIVGEENATAMVTSIPEALKNNEIPSVPEPTVLKTGSTGSSGDDDMTLENRFWGRTRAAYKNLARSLTTFSQCGIN